MSTETLSVFLKTHPELASKYTALTQAIQSYPDAAVALSGGVDSAVVLRVAHQVLGERCLAIVALSPSFPQDEYKAARSLAEAIGVRTEVVTTSELKDPGYVVNGPDRCFHCRKVAFGELAQRARALGFTTLMDGANADDQGDYRPGRDAVRALGVVSPLLEAGMTKQDVRSLAQALDLPVWNKPAAACLSSRIPYGASVTVEALRQIERAEACLKVMGFRDIRVRHYNQLARIEAPADQLALAVERRAQISAALKETGYLYVTLDLEGLRSGSMNLPVIGTVQG